MDDEKPKVGISQKEKLLISILSGFLFLVMSSPITYKIMNILTLKAGFDIEIGGCPNFKGLALHSIIFVVVVFVIMQF